MIAAACCINKDNSLVSYCMNLFTGGKRKLDLRGTFVTGILYGRFSITGFKKTIRICENSLSLQDEMHLIIYVSCISVLANFTIFALGTYITSSKFCTGSSFFFYKTMLVP